ncbi:beta-glucoside-specific PTS transporter subunit IIABC [Vagococcus hydrophili]|uniref:PTS system sucrose-specific EIIBCA component n=1 Tax=Vagococcus hydrophili TaxID=2714947 RepID=A0A6G8AUF0_9ENTE|nr:beta-glucoside-specific PTS transporter subunit IIABC [Vagococcus hydrophili]QIL48684.1 PTS transporter subunit EIIC [Vagococcus hydrophili]
MTHKELAEQIVANIGGTENINQNWHCITRLRFNVKDRDKIKIDDIKQLDGVMGAQFQSGQFQIIIGSEVGNVYQEVAKLTEGKLSETEAPTKKSGNVLDQVFDVISGIFTPILAAITGSGLLKGLMAIAVVCNVLTETSSTYIVLNAIADATFYFLPFLVAFSAANKFKTNPSLGVALAGVLMYPTFIANAAAGEIASLKFLGLSIPMQNYSSTVIPIILAVLLLSYVEKIAKKIVPNSLSIIFVPLICLLVTAPIMLAFIAPLGSLIGTYLEMFFTKLFEIAGPLAGALMGGLMPLIVITGMHYAFFPGTFASIEKFGYDIMLLPLNLVANLAQAGATLGVIFKTKDKKMKQIAISAFIPSVFGITEPAIYGVTMKLKKPFYASMIGGAVGGAIFGTFAVKSFSFAVPGILAVPTYIESGTNNLIYAIIGVLSSFVVGFVMTLLFKFDTGEATSENKISEVNKTNNEAPSKIMAPLSGTVKQLKDCPDETFASELVGKGLGIIPSEGQVVAPFSGIVTMTTPTNHAIGILSDTGVEVLIHVGLETVSLNGEGFKRHIEEGSRVNLGDVLIDFDIKTIQEKNLSLFSPVVITNSPEFLDIVVAVKENEVIEKSKEEVLIVVN